ncbi:MAG: septum formation initiator family protein [Candidatus Desulfatibia sp.]|uniref:FtsB family cell division protein n=1 Tax=Candidatus Desulfatibia sp. TaxID=3101189 RepID=UPI002F30C21F
MNTKQSVLLAFVILAIVALFLFIIFGENGLADLHLLKIERDVLLKQNAELAKKNLSLYREIERLKNDPKYLESVARKELGVVGKDELIFKLKAKRRGEN